MSDDRSARAGSARPIALVGLRCVGKTSAGRVLAELLSLPFVDLDDEIVRAAAPLSSAGEVLQQLGEARFRELEHAALRQVLARRGLFVLATGGGAIEREDNRELLRTRTDCWWLRGELALLQARLAADPHARPALLGADPVAELPALARRREPFYRAVAQWSLDVEHAAPEAVAQRIARELALDH